MRSVHVVHWHQLVGAGEAYHLASHERFRGGGTVHGHDFAEVFWVEAGRAIHEVDRRLHPLATGDVTLVRPEDVHGFRATSADFAITNLAFPRGVIEEFRERYFNGGDLPWGTSTATPHIQLAGARLATLAQLGCRLALGPPRRHLLDRFLLELLDDLVPPAPGGPPLPEWLSTALVDWRNDPEAMRHGVRGLAQRAGRSREHVSRVIREATGRRAIDLVNDTRTEAAAVALRMTDRPIAQIAADVGLLSLSNFYGRFRARFGTTPGSYRRRHRRVMDPGIAADGRAGDTGPVAQARLGHRSQERTNSSPGR